MASKPLNAFLVTFWILSWAATVFRAAVRFDLRAAVRVLRAVRRVVVLVAAAFRRSARAAALRVRFAALALSVATVSTVPATASATLAGAPAAACASTFVSSAITQNPPNLLHCTICIAPHQFKRFFVQCSIRSLDGNASPEARAVMDLGELAQSTGQSRRERRGLLIVLSSPSGA